MKGALQKRDVAQDILELTSDRVSSRCVSMPCQNHQREIRPNRLRFDTFGQGCEFIRHENFLNHDGERSAFDKLVTQSRNISAYEGWPSRLLQ